MAAIVTAAGARDATRLEPLVSSCFLFSIHYTNVYFFRSRLNVLKR